MGATHRLPQVPFAKLTYVGDLPPGKWLSVVALSLHGHNPCIEGTTAAHSKTPQHSGPIQVDPSNKLVTVPQTPLLNASAIFTICYADGNGTAADLTWRDAYIRVLISKVEIWYRTLLHTALMARFQG